MSNKLLCTEIFMTSIWQTSIISLVFIFALFCTANSYATSDDEKNEQLLTKCEDKDAASCQKLADVYGKRTSKFWSPVEAVKYHYQACLYGHSEGCFDTAKALYFGSGVKKDKPNAASFYQKACDLGSAEACYSASGMLYNGDGVEADKSLSQELLIKACTGNHADGCFYAGNLYFHGQGVSVDKAQAINYYSKACELKQAQSCFQVSKMYSEGDGVAKDAEQTKQYLEKSCAAGLSKACPKEAKVKTKPKSERKFVPFCSEKAKQGEWSIVSYPKSFIIEQTLTHVKDTNRNARLTIAYRSDDSYGFALQPSGDRDADHSYYQIFLQGEKVFEGQYHVEETGSRLPPAIPEKVYQQLLKAKMATFRKVERFSKQDNGKPVATVGIDMSNFTAALKIGYEGILKTQENGKNGECRL